MRPLTIIRLPEIWPRRTKMTRNLWIYLFVFNFLGSVLDLISVSGKAFSLKIVLVFTRRRHIEILISIRRAAYIQCLDCIARCFLFFVCSRTSVRQRVLFNDRHGSRSFTLNIRTVLKITAVSHFPSRTIVVAWRWCKIFQISNTTYYIHTYNATLDR